MSVHLHSTREWRVSSRAAPVKVTLVDGTVEVRRARAFAQTPATRGQKQHLSKLWREFNLRMAIPRGLTSRQAFRAGEVLKAARLVRTPGGRKRLGKIETRPLEAALAEVLSDGGGP
jgi:hypothetical protein